MVTPFRYTFIQCSSAEFEMQTQLAYPGNFRASTYFYISQRKLYKVFDNTVASCTLGSGCGRGASIYVVTPVFSYLPHDDHAYDQSVFNCILGLLHMDRISLNWPVSIKSGQFSCVPGQFSWTSFNSSLQAIAGFKKRHKSSHSSSKYLSKSTLKILIFKKMSS